jgi:hydroxymethylpyrimidine pyrophosphatase-like HAD family hydrolase
LLDNGLGFSDVQKIIEFRNKQWVYNSTQKFLYENSLAPSEVIELVGELYTFQELYREKIDNLAIAEDDPFAADPFAENDPFDDNEEDEPSVAEKEAMIKAEIAEMEELVQPELLQLINKNGYYTGGKNFLFFLVIIR